MVYLTTIAAIIAIITVSLAIPSFVIEKTARSNMLLRIRKLLFGACISFFVLAIVVLLVGKIIEKNGRTIETETTSVCSIIDTDGLVIEQKENNLTVIASDGKEIGVYPTPIVKSMVNIDKSGRVTNHCTVNLTVRKTAAIKGFKLFGIWVAVKSSDSYPVAVILD